MGVLILIAEADPTRCEELERSLRAQGHTVISCADTEEMTRRGPIERPALCFVPDTTPGSSNDLRRLAGIPSRPALLSLPGDQLGDEPEGLAQRIEYELENRALRLQREESLRREAEMPLVLAGESPAIRRLRQGIERVAATDTPVLLRGERGVGKRDCAAEIHRRSHRRRIFVEVRCDDPERLVLETLFGGGASLLPAALDRADGGSLHLVHVDRASPGIQRRLLEAMEEGNWAPPGATARALDVRWIASSERDLADEAERGRFSGDLLYRLDVLELVVPPLRERLVDVPALIQALNGNQARERGTGAGPSPADLETQGHPLWPGNLEQLRAALHLSPFISPTTRAMNRDNSPFQEDAFEGQRRLRDVEKALIRRVLTEEGGNRSRAARILGVNRTTLYNKLRSYDLGTEDLEPGRLESSGPEPSF